MKKLLKKLSYKKSMLVYETFAGVADYFAIILFWTSLAMNAPLASYAAFFLIAIKIILIPLGFPPQFSNTTQSDRYFLKVLSYAPHLLIGAVWYYFTRQGLGLNTYEEEMGVKIFEGLGVNPYASLIPYTLWHCFELVFIIGDILKERFDKFQHDINKPKI